MQLKSKQILLYILACAILLISKVAGGALLALATLMQLSILIQQIPFTKQSQLAFFKLFLITLPVTFLWGGAHSFVFIYLKQGSWLQAIMAFSLSFTLILVLNFQLLYSNQFLEKNNFQVIRSLNDAFNEIKNNTRRFFKTAGLIFMFSFFPWGPDDWKLVFALTATLVVLNPLTLKKAFSRS
jgi:hypothetical protein